VLQETIPDRRTEQIPLGVVCGEFILGVQAAPGVVLNVMIYQTMLDAACNTKNWWYTETLYECVSSLLLKLVCWYSSLAPNHMLDRLLLFILNTCRIQYNSYAFQVQGQ
jgi:hypothetical protein